MGLSYFLIVYSGGQPERGNPPEEFKREFLSLVTEVGARGLTENGLAISPELNISFLMLKAVAILAGDLFRSYTQACGVNRLNQRLDGCI